MAESVDENHALVSENAFLIDLKDKSKKKVQVLETLVAKKKDRIKDISAELENNSKESQNAQFRFGTIGPNFVQR